MTDKLYSQMAAPAAALVDARGHQLLQQLGDDLAALIAAGATHNDFVAALAHWSALFAAAAQDEIFKRAQKRFGVRAGLAEMALEIFLADVATRTRIRRAQVLAEGRPN